MYRQDAVGGGEPSIVARGLAVEIIRRYPHPVRSEPLNRLSVIGLSANAVELIAAIRAATEKIRDRLIIFSTKPFPAPRRVCDIRG